MAGAVDRLHSAAPQALGLMYLTARCPMAGAPDRPKARVAGSDDGPFLLRQWVTHASGWPLKKLPLARRSGAMPGRRGFAGQFSRPAARPKQRYLGRAWDLGGSNSDAIKQAFQVALFAEMQS